MLVHGQLERHFQQESGGQEDINFLGVNCLENLLQEGQEFRRRAGGAHLALSKTVRRIVQIGMDGCSQTAPQ
jgi:hypothetical protein